DLSCGPQLYIFRGSITRPASSFPPASYAHYWGCTWSSLLTCWLGFGQVGFAPCGTHPLGNNNQFHRIAPNSKVSGLPWHEQCVVRPSFGEGQCFFLEMQPLPRDALRLSSSMCRPSYTPFARERPDSKRIEPCQQDPQGSWYRRHVERTDKLETRADKLRRMTQVDAMPCPRHAEHADVGVQTLQAIEFGITEDGPLREVPRHNDGRTAQPARKLVRVEPVPRPPRGKRRKGRGVHVGHVLRTVQGFLQGLPGIDLQQELGER